MSIYSLFIIGGCGLVTWLPRVIPFLLVKKLQLPEIAIRFLSYVPLCILTALFVQNLFIVKPGAFPCLNWEYCLAAIPAIFMAVLTRNLMWIVITGVAGMALIRYFIV
jgi:branched-subunit amino acid transport protein